MFYKQLMAETDPEKRSRMVKSILKGWNEDDESIQSFLLWGQYLQRNENYRKVCDWVTEISQNDPIPFEYKVPVDGEALALKWSDIDFSGRFINVERGFSMGKIETPKSGKSRKVDMSLQLAEALKALNHERKIETLKKGWNSIPEWLFVNERGNPLDRNNWRRRVFNKALEQAKFRKVRVHDLRHTYASQLIQAGESLAYIKDQLGHHSIKVTVDIYGHLAPEGNKAAVDALDDPRVRNPDVEIRNLSAT